MKIKYNIPKLNEFKEKIYKIKERVIDNRKNKTKIPVKYYALLYLMLIIGGITFSININKYNNVKKEDYTKYEIQDNINVDSNVVNKVLYETAISSISTNIASEEKDLKANEMQFIWPVEGEILKEYAADKLVYSNTLDIWQTHPGIDIAAKLDTPVKVICNGKIIEITNNEYYGNTVKIEHEKGYISIYSNLKEVDLINVGDNVKQGDIIGKIGISANSEILDDYHLHFEISKNNIKINPLEILE